MFNFFNKYLLLLFVCLVQMASFGQKKIKTERAEEKKDNPMERVDFDKKLVADPKTGKIPVDELVKAHVQVKERFKNEPLLAISGIDWKERGPNNIGGRTRALMLDPNDATKKRVWAGGVAGGLWYNNDITSGASSWVKVNDFWDNLAVSCIASDPSNSQVFYVGTGEGWYNVDAVKGGGIWKTTNGGTTWTLLTATVPTYSSPTAIQFAFQTVQKIVVASNGNVFAGTQYGVWKSTDGGVSWTNNKVIDSSGGAGKNYCSDLEYVNGVLYAAFGRGDGTSIHKSTDNGANWTTITPPSVTGGRTELGVGNSNTIYAVSDKYFSTISYFKKSTNGGTTWSDVSIPTDASLSTDVTNGQAWYDLILAVHPSDDNVVYIGGASFARSVNGGTSWYCFPYGNNVHPDHHNMIFRTGSTNQMIMSNDGGVYYSTNFGDKTITASATAFAFATRNLNYNVTQPYSVAQKNLDEDGYILMGLQDNGSIKIPGVKNTVGSGTEVLGGDGMLCFIDQDNPGYQFATYQYNSFQLFNSSGTALVDLAPHYGGDFVNPADYDSQNNILYSFEGDFGTLDFSRYQISGTNTYTYNYFSMIDNTLSVSFIKAGLVANTVFVGTANGYVYKLTGITNVDGNQPTQTTVFDPTKSGSAGNVSCIEIGASENELIVTQSNYGVKSVFYTNNGGTTWTSKDESTHGLPNIPIRYALFNPNDRKQVLLATELGVWSTRDITASNPDWQPTNSNLANVRCDMLRYRSADHQVAVATHGRGIFTAYLCPSDVTKSSTLAGSQSVYSNTYIKGNTANVVQSGTIKYKAQNYILLEPKFEAQSGSVFSATVGAGCY